MLFSAFDPPDVICRIGVQMNKYTLKTAWKSDSTRPILKTSLCFNSVIDSEIKPAFSLPLKF